MDESNRIFVKPKNSKFIVRHPGMVSRILKPEGEWVTDSVAWQRLIRDEDVITSMKETPEKQELKKEKKDSSHSHQGDK